jgi:hypothetical protein
VAADPGNIFDVLFQAAGVDREQEGVSPSLPADVDLDTAMDLTTPVLPPTRPEVPKLVEEVRATLNEGTGHVFHGHPLPDLAVGLEWAVEMQLETYETPRAREPDRIYVLEFQGYRRQYVMFGHTTNLKKRLVAHRLAATPHGFALLQGWVSPGAARAQPLEQLILMIAMSLHGYQHFHERFYDMPFTKGLSIARAVFELHTDWRSRRERSENCTLPDGE